MYCSLLANNRGGMIQFPHRTKQGQFVARNINTYQNCN
jgi:hypothetical protein